MESDVTAAGPAGRGDQDRRIERDSLGEVAVPAEAYYGVQTVRAIENFPISGVRPFPDFVWATALIKQAAAETNASLGLLDRRLADAISRAAAEVVAGSLREQFVVDVFQAGAGTSHNMNANEVVANRAVERLGGSRGDYALVHPNDHVNMAQSTNDVIPTAIKLASLRMLSHLLPATRGLADALDAKGHELDGVIKSGRTHLQDAVPIRLGQEFAAYGAAIARRAAWIEMSAEDLHELNLGATAAGTGMNSHPDYPAAVTRRLADLTGYSLRPAPSLIEATQSLASFAQLSGALRSLALELIRIANDLRLMSSGPLTGLAEITLPAVQPGSSIMPGKVNPVMAEMLDMVCFQVVGNDTAVALAVQADQLELNVMMPAVAYALLQSIQILTTSQLAFAERCVRGITANVERCREMAEASLGLATALNTYVGYSEAAKIAQESLATGKPIRQLVLEKGLMAPEDVSSVLDPRALTEPGIPGRRELRPPGAGTDVASATERSDLPSAEH
jgi:aspartate ammonia-lyase